MICEKIFGYFKFFCYLCIVKVFLDKQSQKSNKIVMDSW